MDYNLICQKQNNLSNNIIWSKIVNKIKLKRKLVVQRLPQKQRRSSPLCVSPATPSGAALRPAHYAQSVLRMQGDN